MTQNFRSVRFGRIALASIATVILSLLFCMAAAVLIENGWLPMNWSTTVSSVAIAVATVVCCGVLIGGKGEGAAIEIAAAAAITVAILFILKLLLFPERQSTYLPTIAGVLIAGTATCFLTRPRQRKRNKAARGLRRRK